MLYLQALTFSKIKGSEATGSPAHLGTRGPWAASQGGRSAGGEAAGGRDGVGAPPSPLFAGFLAQGGCVGALQRCSAGLPCPLVGRCRSLQRALLRRGAAALGGGIYGAGGCRAGLSPPSLLQGFPLELLHLCPCPLQSRRVGAAAGWMRGWGETKRERSLLRRGGISGGFSCRSRAINPPIPSALRSPEVLEGPWSCPPPAASRSHLGYAGAGVSPAVGPSGPPCPLHVTMQPPQFGVAEPIPGTCCSPAGPYGIAQPRSPSPSVPSCGMGRKTPEEGIFSLICKPRAHPNCWGSGTQRPVPSRSR